MTHRIVQMVQLANLILLGLTVASCGGDSGTGPTIKVDSQGFTQDIRALIPDSIMRIIDSAGMPIYSGANPPNVQGGFYMNPNVLLNGNVPGDSIGSFWFPPYIVFSNQNNDNLTVQLQLLYGADLEAGLRSFIVGHDSVFSVFSSITEVFSGDTANGLHVVSGIMADSGIRNVYVALVMINNHGSVHFIANGQWRVFYDPNGLSQRVPTVTINRSVPPRFMQDLPYDFSGSLLSGQ